MCWLYPPACGCRTPQTRGGVSRGALLAGKAGSAWLTSSGESSGSWGPPALAAKAAAPRAAARRTCWRRPAWRGTSGPPRLRQRKGWQLQTDPPRLQQWAHRRRTCCSDRLLAWASCLLALCRKLRTLRWCCWARSRRRMAQTLRWHCLPRSLPQTLRQRCFATGSLAPCPCPGPSGLASPGPCPCPSGSAASPLPFQNPWTAAPAQLGTAAGRQLPSQNLVQLPCPLGRPASPCPGSGRPPSSAAAAASASCLGSSAPPCLGSSGPPCRRCRPCPSAAGRTGRRQSPQSHSEHSRTLLPGLLQQAGPSRTSRPGSRRTDRRPAAAAAAVLHLVPAVARPCSAGLMSPTPVPRAPRPRLGRSGWRREGRGRRVLTRCRAPRGRARSRPPGSTAPPWSRPLGGRRPRQRLCPSCACPPCRCRRTSPGWGTCSESASSASGRAGRSRPSGARCPAVPSTSRTSARTCARRPHSAALSAAPCTAS
mmetsp:Transcript_26353/g.75648  ORF Transcript_26353/g.75648 Transcript_26353/m.75648 type:complete len:482 (+) Transcript_26353:95-1540(+)